MNLAELSIKRPIFVTCVVLASLAVGLLSLAKLPVNLFPDVTFPVVTVTTPYPGAGPEEVETLISRPLEEEFSSLGGVKRLTSYNREGVSVVVAEFNLGIDVKYAEQQIRDRTATARRKMPDEALEAVIRKIDPADQPILRVSVSADLPPAQLFDLADRIIRPKIEQVNQVGLVEVYGGRKREIRIELDRKKLKEREMSASMVTARIKAAGMNIPAGKLENSEKETVVRTVGEFRNLKDIENTVLNFAGNEVPVTVSDIATVKDTLADEKTQAFVNGKRGMLLLVYRQAGSNTIEVADGVTKRLEALNEQMKNDEGKPTLAIVQDGAKPVRANVDDVRESILFGIVLTIIVVFFFLGSARSTFITGLALPNSLIGAFILMALMGFSINLMTLLALSLAVGLLIDDAIVVRENIFRHVEMGKGPIEAALIGTKEVSLAVVATTLTVIAVFGPIAFLQGVVGQFFKEFGLTICFAMAISLFDALTMAPMLSAYYAGASNHGKKKGPIAAVLGVFNRFQDWLERRYLGVLKFTLRRPWATLAISFGVVALSLVAASQVPKTFLPAQDNGEFTVDIDLPPGTSLTAMSDLALKVEDTIRKNPEVAVTVLVVGDANGTSNKASFFVNLVPSKQRKGNTSQFKDKLREQLKVYAQATPKVKDFDAVGGGMRPFTLNIIGPDLKELERIGSEVLAKLKKSPALKDVDVSFRPGKPEFQVAMDLRKAERLGVSSAVVGTEVRNLLEGTTPAVFREKGEEYDIRIRLKDDQRDLAASYPDIYVPNVNMSLVKLSNVSNPVQTLGPSNIDRLDRGRFVQVGADMAPGGPGMGGAIQEVNQMFANEIKLPPGFKYSFTGQAENFKELATNMLIAAGLGIVFIYLVLASLYESFVTPFTIMLVLPLAACGAFYALFFANASLDLFSMIGCVMLLGIATKNSILLVDYANQKIAEGMSRADAMLEAGRTRLRPILMTSFALVAGMIPLAIGLNEASKQRTSLGIAVIGGIVSSTLLTLVVIPASFSYIDRFRVWALAMAKRIFSPQGAGSETEVYGHIPAKEAVVGAQARRVDSARPSSARPSDV